MNGKLFWLATLLVLGACSPFLTPTPSDSGTRGQVTIRPKCPVMQAGVPCPDKPYQAVLTVLAAQGRQRILCFQTQADGTFEIPLAPGAYILHPESSGPLPFARDVTVNVAPHRFTH